MLSTFRIVWCQTCNWNTEAYRPNSKATAKKIAARHETQNSGHICRISVEYVRTTQAVTR